MTKSDLDTHVRILGWVHIVMSSLFLLIGVGVSALMLFGGLFSGDAEAFGIVTIVAIFVGGLMLVIGLPGILAGIGLLKRKNWGRILAIIVGVLNITNIPVGTIIGIYTLYVLLQSSAGAYFE